jgi:hypothetical protein
MQDKLNRGGFLKYFIGSTDNLWQSKYSEIMKGRKEGRCLTGALAKREITKMAEIPEQKRLNFVRSTKFQLQNCISATKNCQSTNDSMNYGKVEH